MQTDFPSIELLRVPRSMNILIVDDCVAQRDLLKAHLRTLRFKNIDQAENGIQAYQLLVQAKAIGNPYHLVISDWNMPEMNGLKLFDSIRKTSGFEDLPFILLTTENDETKILKAISAGVSNYMLKPLVQEVLVDKLARTWARKSG